MAHADYIAENMSKTKRTAYRFNIFLAGHEHTRMGTH